MNMNKYQEALEQLKTLDCVDENNFDIKNKNIPILQELVDKATPKKAVWIEDFLRCPSCFNYDSLSDGYGEHHNYCNECGQSLDLSKE